MKYRTSNVEVAKVAPLVEELVARCGSPEAAAEYAGLGVSTLYRIRHREHRTMQAETARLVILALYERRKEDRRNGTSPRFKAARQHQAQIEEGLRRLAGY